MAPPPSSEVQYGPLSVMVPSLRRSPRKRVKPPPMPSEKRKEIQARRRERQDDIDEDLRQWYQDTSATANAMSQKYGKPARHYMELLFSTGTHMLKKRGPNAFNAFVSAKAQEVNSDAPASSAVPLRQIQEDYREEYEALSDHEKDLLIEDLKTKREADRTAPRLNQRSRAQDAKATLAAIEKMIFGLKCRTGIEAFFCVVRNNPEFKIQPHWYFTHPEVERYLTATIRRGWDTDHIGAIFEAFSVAGCDRLKILRTAKAQADYLKTEIRDKINQMLVDIAQNPKAIMQYTSYQKAIVERYGIALEGWTHPTWACPSHLSTSVPPLEKLLRAIEEGKCKFVKLSRAQLEERRKEYERAVASGELAPPKERKRRRDADRPRGPRTSGQGVGHDDAVEEEDEGEGGDEDEDEDEGSPQVQQQPHKRARHPPQTQPTVISPAAPPPPRPRPRPRSVQQQPPAAQSGDMLSPASHAPQAGDDTPPPAAHAPQAGDMPPPALHVPQAADMPSPALHVPQQPFNTPQPAFTPQGFGYPPFAGYPQSAQMPNTEFIFAPPFPAASQDSQHNFSQVNPGYQTLHFAPPFTM